MNTIFDEINEEFRAIQESISDDTILQENVNIGLASPDILDENALTDKIKNSVTSIKTKLNNHKEKRSKKRELTAKYAEVLKIAKKLTVPNGKTVKMHDGTNRKMEIHMPFNSASFFSKKILKSVLNTKNYKNSAPNSSAADAIKSAFAEQLKYVVPSYNGSMATAAEVKSVIMSYYLGKVLVVTPNIQALVYNLTQAPKILANLDVNYVKLANNFSAEMLGKINEMKNDNKYDKHISLVMTILNATLNESIRINELMYNIVYTIAEEAFRTIKALAPEVKAINEDAVTPPVFDKDPTAEVTTPAIVTTNANDTGAGDSASQQTVGTDDVGTILSTKQDINAAQPDTDNKGTPTETPPKTSVQECTTYIIK